MKSLQRADLLSPLRRRVRGEPQGRERPSCRPIRGTTYDAHAYPDRPRLGRRGVRAMRIALFGAGGIIGRRILDEALRRGHQVTAVVRDPTRFSGPADRVAVVQGDVVDAASVAAAVRGHDAVISAVGPAHTAD